MLSKKMYSYMINLEKFWIYNWNLNEKENFIFWVLFYEVFLFNFNQIDIFESFPKYPQ